MRRVLTPSHATFSAANRTITFTTTVPASISHILRVVNLTRATVYFDPTGDLGLGYLSSATYASPVLTLGVEAEDQADTDKLFIEYDDGLGGGGGGGGGGDASEAKQDVLIGHVDGVEGALGAPADAAASSDTGTFSLIALFKRGLQSLTTLLSRTPALQGGAVPVVDLVPTRTPATTSVASSATSVTILASNANRRGISIANDSTAVLRLSYATPATAANAFIVMQPGSFLALDQQLMITSTIYGIWAAANGTAQVTEYV